jgi:hypothetical protein
VVDPDAGTATVHDTQPVGTVTQLPCCRGHCLVGSTVAVLVPLAGPAVWLTFLPDRVKVPPGTACLQASRVCSQIVVLLAAAAWAGKLIAAT